MKSQEAKIEGTNILEMAVQTFRIVALTWEEVPAAARSQLRAALALRTGSHACPACTIAWSRNPHKRIALAMGPEGNHYVCEECADKLLANGVAEVPGCTKGEWDAVTKD